MKYRIDGVEYDVDEVDPSGADMIAMSKQAGMGLQTWQWTISQLSRLAWSDGPGSAVVVLSEAEAAEHSVDGHEPCWGCPNENLFTESPKHMTAVLVLLWLARRAGGEPTLPYEVSAAVPWSRFEALPDDEEDEAPGAGDDLDEDADPTPPPASGPGTGGGARKASKRSSKA
ncbi:MAG: hypothetical protein ACRCSL_12205 [Microbacterium sp.]